MYSYNLVSLHPWSSHLSTSKAIRNLCVVLSVALQSLKNKSVKYEWRQAQEFCSPDHFSPGAGQRLTWYYALKVGVNSCKGEVNLWFTRSISYQWDFIGFKRHYNQPQDDQDEHCQLPLVSCPAHAPPGEKRSGEPS